MTREEEIWNAINNLKIGVYDEDISSDNDDYNNDEYDGSDLQNAFYAGAEWADKNPANPWISVKDDLPSNHKELIHSYRYTVPVLIRCNDSRHHIIRMYRLNDKDWGWIDYAKSITHWMSIPKL